MDSVRSKYQKYGVKNFYQFNYDQYNNPHEPIINDSLKFVNENWKVNFSKTLDLACGKGEVSKALIKLGYNNIDAVDAYSCKYYITEHCQTLAFDDIIKGALDNKKYSIVVCSFALHLLEISKLPTLLYKLTQISDQLLILSPHKRPEIKENWGWSLQNEMVLDKVRTRLFNNIVF